MTRLFAAAGIDYVQWRALARAYTQIDYAAILGAYGHDASMKAVRHLFFYATVWTFFGSGAALYVWIFSDVWLSATIMTTTTGMLVAFPVLAQAATLIAPDDYEIVGFRPVTSRTYFAVRATALLLQTIEMAVFTGYLPVIAFLTRSHGSWQQALAAVLAISSGAVCTTLSVAAIYGWLLKMLPPARLTRLVTYASVVLLLGVMGMNAAFFIGLGAVSDRNIVIHDTLTLSRGVWILAYPPAWFASYVAIARGGAGGLAWTAAGLSVAAMALLVALLGERLTASYAMRVAQGFTQTTTVAGESGGRWSALVRETRVVAIIARAQFRDDLTFQMGVVMMFLMPAIFLGVGWFTGSGADPFVERGHLGNVIMLSVFVAPSGFAQTFATTPSHAASWVFFTTPADRVRLITASRDIAAVSLMVPITLAVAALMWLSYHHAGHALLEAAFVGVLGYLNLQVSVLFRPALPFSQPAAAGKRPVMPAGLGIVPMLTGIALFIVASLFAFRSLTSFALTSILVCVASIALNVWTRRRLAARIGAIEYAG